MTEDGASSGAGVREGDVLAGKYRVERVLGMGGVGIVVAAHHLHLDERVALKFLLPHALANHEAVARFLREAKAAAKIKGEHVARVSDVGQLENGAPYIVMEYLEGMDLSGWLRQQGRLPIEQAVDFVLQTCEAIADAHALGIVHRDLKPANLFCVERSDGGLCVKVLDFGISKVTTEGAQDLTMTSALMGSPLYMSPEQMKMSKSVDARSDIWSLGVILFELVTGHAPFNAEGLTDLAIKIANDPAPPLGSLRLDAPAGLEPVVAKCMEKSRERRFSNVGELALALKEFGSEQARLSADRVVGTLRRARGPGSMPPPPSSVPPPSLPPALALSEPPPPALLATGDPARTGVSWGQTASGTRSGIVAGVGAAMALAVLALVGLVVWRTLATSGATSSRSSPQPEPVTAPLPSGPATTAQSPAPAASPVPDAEQRAASPVPTSPPAPPHPTSPVTPPVTHPVGAHPAPPTPPTGTPPTPPAAATRPNCNPSFRFDADGNKIFKPECFGQ